MRVLLNVLDCFYIYGIQIWIFFYAFYTCYLVHQKTKDSNFEQGDLIHINDILQNCDTVSHSVSLEFHVDKEGCNQHIDLNNVINYLHGNGYPSYVSTKNEKSNFRRQCRALKKENQILIYKKTSAKVVFNKNEQRSIIQMIHDGSNNSAQSSALSSHRGRDATHRILKSRFYWPHMTLDIKNYIKECKICQQVNPGSLKFIPELKSVPVPKKV